MKKFLGLLILISTFSYSQDLDTLALDSVGIDTVEQLPPAHYVGAYGVAQIKLSPHLGGYNAASALGLGIQYDKWSLSVIRQEFIGNIEAFVVFPNVFELKYQYLGPTVGFEFQGNEVVSSQLVFSHQWGDMTWVNLETNEDFVRDRFSISSIGIDIDIDKFRYAKPYLNIGYQRMNNLELERVNNEDFSGFFVVFGIRAGYFNQ